LIATAAHAGGVAAPEGAAFALESVIVRGEMLAQSAAPPADAKAGLSAERAQVLLQSLTLPGWGQATLGQTRAAWTFGLFETAIWGSFIAFRAQNQMRVDAYENTASIFAGIDLSDRDEEYRRTVGSFVSSDEYNLFVVYRDAANLYYDNPTAYRAYIDEHSIGGQDGWSWSSPEAFERYRTQREEAHRAANRSNTMLAAAIVNRVLSALHAARTYGRMAPNESRWSFEVVPTPAVNDPSAFRAGVSARF